MDCLSAQATQLLLKVCSVLSSNFAQTGSYCIVHISGLSSGHFTSFETSELFSVVLEAQPLTIKIISTENELIIFTIAI